ncbi:caffeoyl-CoA O-methyltransferase isoform X2 [Vitis vinifera]|uniref:caffeoyl-CoA O-methyltransferase isoform X2 n=1 Tax=Vitis vinifera TaxID=29760 RepID=UPI00053F4719|nr:caffeoyl-CoA O-methyltransferase isoform X2 [Vitis vinifera]|eukprot:XP_010657006.1 PREDICTED: caffeoyl-CoA O-methyltransferase isoform X2 [Vitis vinifera]
MEEATNGEPNEEFLKIKKGLLQSDELLQYILETSVYPREPQPLKEIRDASAHHQKKMMLTTPDAGQLMVLLLKLINAKKTIEIGIIAIDIDREAFELGFPIIEKAGVQHKIDFIEAPGLEVLDRLLEDPNNEDSFDYVFVDADKDNYINYHEKLMKLVKIGGLILYDNTLWFGTVALPNCLVPEKMKYNRDHIIKFNKALSDDSRIQISQVPVGDGLTICRRLY